MNKKIIYILFSSLFILILLSKIALSVQVVEVAQATPQENKGHFWDFLKSYYFWLAIVGLIVFALVMLGIFLLVRWIVKFIKQRSDIFWKMKTERMQMAKIHARYPCNHWWKVHKNTPIRLAKKDQNGKIYISKPIGYHRGDYSTHEGNLCISMNLEGNKKYFFFPVRDLLIIPNKEKVKITQRNDKGEKLKDIEFTLPTAKDMIQWNENEILLFAEGVSRVGIFVIPVLKSEDGGIIDLALPIFATLKEVVLGDYLYQQSGDFVSLTRKAIDMNPTIRGIQKVNDSNANVEISPSGNQP
jgi:hypothetical protein